MPRSSSSSSMKSSPSRSFHAPSSKAVVPYRPSISAVAPMPSPPMYTPPTTGQILKESIVSGVGMGIGTRIASAIFGPPTVNMNQVAPAPTSIPLPTQNPAFQQCQQNATPEDKPLCMRLYNTELSYNEFKQCMESSGNQIHMCKDYLPMKN